MFTLSSGLCGNGDMVLYTPSFGKETDNTQSVICIGKSAMTSFPRVEVAPPLRHGTYFQPLSISKDC